MAVQHGQQHGQAVAVQADRQAARADGPPLSTSAWISTSIGRVPSSVTSTQLPGTGSLCCDRKIALGLATPFRPFSVMANTPISLTAPKRFLMARTRRKLEWVSPSKYSTVSTMCSSTRGPASAPSLVTWPTSTMQVPPALAARVRCAAHSRTCATEPGAEVSWSEYTVWIESITATAGWIGRDGGEDFFELDLGQHLDLRVVQAEAARAQRDLGAAFLAGDVERGHLRALQAVERLQQQGRLADAGIAADQHHAAFDDAAAQHPVELADAGGRALDLAGLDVGQRGHLGGLGQRGETVAVAGAAASATVSISVFQASQCGHLPSQRGLVPPHSVQV